MVSALASTAINGDPGTYEEAMASDEKDLWKAAIREECASIIANKTFATEREGPTKGFRSSATGKPIGSKWVFKTKRNPDGTTRHKVRLVIKGYMQSDWGETYAPVGKLASFRYLASQAAGLGLDIDHMDVVTAFLNPEVDDPDLYMAIPEGWDSGKDGISAGSIVRLQKALYGLKQAPRLWYQDIDEFLRLSLNFVQSHADPNVYVYGKGKARMLLLLYVDDMSMAYSKAMSAAAADIKAKLGIKYKITNLGAARQFLGIEITRNGTDIALGQRAFIDTILRRFGMEDSNGVSTPMDTDVKLDLAEANEEREVDPAPYQAIVGSLMYVALATRPDISFAVSALSRYNSCPRTSHITAAKRALRYLKKTADYRLHFDGNDNEIIGYTDSDWANDSADRKSQGGHVFLCNGGAISWQSRKQTLVALSTTEAEYVACSEASREARWLRQLQRDINGDIYDHDYGYGHHDDDVQDADPIRVFSDSRGALAHITTAGGITKARTKHIDVCYHNSRDLHARGIVLYDYVNTDDNPADILTKALARGKHEKFTRAMGIW
jgi:hypothetical protein